MSDLPVIRESDVSPTESVYGLEAYSFVVGERVADGIAVKSGHRAYDAAFLRWRRTCRQTGNGKKLRVYRVVRGETSDAD